MDQIDPVHVDQSLFLPFTAIPVAAAMVAAFIFVGVLVNDEMMFGVILEGAKICYGIEVGEIRTPRRRGGRGRSCGSGG
jgi:hypothetical protein